MSAVTEVDETVIVNLKFSGNRLAVFTCSAGFLLPNDAVVVGTKGTIKVDWQCCTYTEQKSRLVNLPPQPPDSRSHVVPDNTGGQRQSNRVPATGTLLAHQLHSQHRDALPSRGGSTVFAQRYSTQVVELQLMLLWRGNDVHSDRQLFQNDLTPGLGKLRPGDHKWSDLVLMQLH